MAKKYKIKPFKRSELKRPGSNNTLARFNKIIDHINRNSNLQIKGAVHQSQNSRGSKYYIKKGRGGGGGDCGEILFGEITVGLEYADELSIGYSQYEAVLDNNPSVGFIIPKIFNESSKTGGGDYRNYVPWVPIGSDPVPFLLCDGVYYFMNMFHFVGTNTEKSISWNEEFGLVQSVFA